MINFLLAVGIYSGLFVFLFLCIKMGYGFGEWKKTQTHQNLDIVKVVEATVFALLGLLIAFSFTSAYDRFENRKLRIIEEVNSISTAYHRIDLLKPAFQNDMRNLFKEYLDERIATYGRLAEFGNFTTEFEHLNQLQKSVWEKSVQTAAVSGEAATLLFIQAVGNMLDVAATRLMITRIHPPAAIFILLIGLAALSSFLAGYGMAKNKAYSLIYILSFAAITAFTLYVIIDLEFPRMGMIRVDAFDVMLAELRHDLK